MCAFTGGACEREDIQDVHVGEPCRSCRDDDNPSPERLHQHGNSIGSPNANMVVNGFVSSLTPARSDHAAEDNSAGETEGEIDEIQFDECQHGKWLLMCDVCLGPVDVGENGLVDHEESQDRGGP